MEKNPRNFTEFTKIITNADEIITNHRGYKQLLFDIFNVLLTIVTFGLKSTLTSDWRFFTCNTATKNIVDEINENIEKIKTNSGPRPGPKLK